MTGRPLGRPPAAACSCPRRSRRCCWSCRWWRWSPRPLARAARPSWRSEPLREALWLSLLTSTAGDAGLPGARAAAGLAAGPRRLPRPRACCGRWSPCRWCCRRSSPASRCARRSAAPGFLGEPLLDADRLRASRSRRGAWCWPTCSSRMPFVVISIEGALRSDGPGVRRRRGDARRHPLDDLPPGDGAAGAARASSPAMVLGWARSLGEFGATITFNGNYPGTTQTMPTLIYVTRQSDQDAALALSLVMLLVSVVVLLALRDRWLGTPHGAAHDRPDDRPRGPAARCRPGAGSLHGRPGRRGRRHRTQRRRQVVAGPGARRPGAGHGPRPARRHRPARASPPATAASAWSSRASCCSPTSRALDNVAFGPRARGVPTAEADAARPGVARPVRHRRAGRPQAPAALRRPGPAGGDRPRAGHRAPAAAARRAADRARRQGRHGAAHRAAAATSRRTTGSRCWSPTTPSTR